MERKQHLSLPDVAAEITGRSDLLLPGTMAGKSGEGTSGHFLSSTPTKPSTSTSFAISQLQHATSQHCSRTF